MAERRMLLVSLGLGAVSQFMHGDVQGKRLAFVPTAGDPYSDRSFVERDRQLLLEMGFDLFDVDLNGSTPGELRDQFDGIDVLFVSGGNSFYLLQKARESGFRDALLNLLDRGIPYIGASAGAVILGPDLRPVDTLDDPDAAPGLDSMEGLGLVDFVVLPHYGIEKYLSAYEEIIRRYDGILPLIPLRNNQAVLVTGKGHKIIESSE